jgi:hypothetical protein
MSIEERIRRLEAALGWLLNNPFFSFDASRRYDTGKEAADSLRQQYKLMHPEEFQ